MSFEPRVSTMPQFSHIEIVRALNINNLLYIFLLRRWDHYIVGVCSDSKAIVFEKFDDIIETRLFFDDMLRLYLSYFKFCFVVDVISEIKVTF